MLPGMVLPLYVSISRGQKRQLFLSWMDASISGMARQGVLQGETGENAAYAARHPKADCGKFIST